ncbi:protein regulator of cytokinesis 1 [Engraulis encrasicolus]|uniref:protein regulator of cytokinesis 1 n=1 Tax=Engraulis encrasicolus TaxID=184585 RepID=UPI002FD71F39
MPSRKSESLVSSMISGINIALAQLEDLWDSMGIVEEQRLERVLTVKTYMEDLLRRMIEEEEACRSRLKANIVTSQKQVAELCAELMETPCEMEDGLSILQLEKELRCRLEALTAEKNSRMSDLETLKQEDEMLCMQLCSTPHYVPSNVVPSRAQLKALQEHVAELTAEKATRLAVSTALRKDVALLGREIGHDPDTSLERDALSDDPEVFLLTHDNIRALQELIGKLELKKRSLISTRDKLKERAMSLWNRLDCPEKDGGFPLDTQGTLTDDISRWKVEVERLEELQKAQLERVISKARVELVDMWEKCLFGPEQRQPFSTHLYDANYTEELLLVHDAELVKLRDYQEQARPLLDNLEKWEKNWTLFQDFERKASDPSRFSNRGGALLKETKERAKVQRMLPKLEEEMKGAAEAWQRTHGTAFLVRGQKLMEYISGQREEYKLQKEKEKSERMKKTDNANKKGDSTLFKTPTKRAMMSTSTSATPNKVVKKTPNQTLAITPNQTVVRGAAISSTLTPVQFSKPPLGPSKAHERAPLQEFNGGECPAITYSDFTSELSRKNSQEAVLNSTVCLDLERGAK